jgi:Fic family protein
MAWIYEQANWPQFTSDSSRLLPLIAEVRYRQGKLIGFLQTLGIEQRQKTQLSALAAEIIGSSSIEGEILDPEQVRSSIARNLGIAQAEQPLSPRNVVGFVELILDATQNSLQPLTAERLFSWHAALFPASQSKLRKITVGACR